nr:immunoglobulin light chain junction region [Macaca mulatta]MOV92340.1 immunoglobulin light chain junction region [Macaca mulatta]MOV92374.1 immunoglobulin light chain junction region [Macaca mulatta]MOV92493.1 immunoglobulin light chain junction region [Macaca mulatta]MOV92509.1 immunoglobulin light chain junction region [Macaca mulatta]
CMQDVQLPPTF